MRRLAWLALLPLSVSAESLAPSPPQHVNPLRVGQVGTGTAVQYAACNGDCAPRTPKFVALRAPETPSVPQAVPTPVAPRIVQVHFAFGRTTLDAEAKRELQAVVASITGAEDLTVRGRTDPTGPHSFNYRLAQRRAQAVRQALIAAGVPASKVRALRYDPCCEGDPKAPREVMADLRRADVDIVITGKPLQ